MTNLEVAFLNGLYAAATWHERQADGFRDMSKDEPRLPPDIRNRAAQAATHHGASAVGIRQLACRKLKEFQREQN